MFSKSNLIIDLNERPELVDIAAAWFHDKWKVPKQAYFDSMKSASISINGVPLWYIIVNKQEEIIAGLGVIENDFHKRLDLTPNICALYVEESNRHLGIARMLLDYACAKLAKNGINQVYLCTTHIDFYERCGWTFFDMIEENDGNMIRMYQYTNTN